MHPDNPPNPASVRAEPVEALKRGRPGPVLSCSHCYTESARQRTHEESAMKTILRVIQADSGSGTQRIPG